MIISGGHLFINHFVITIYAITVRQDTANVNNIWKYTGVFKMSTVSFPLLFASAESGSKL